MWAWAVVLACGRPPPADETPVVGGRHSGGYVDEVHYGPPLIEAIDVSCGERLEVDASLGGWSGGGVVYLVETADPEPWAEEHDLASYRYDLFGAWDLVRVELATGVDRAAQERDVSTAFTCAGELERTDRLTWALATFDLWGGLADCRVWGHDPAALTSGVTSLAPEADPPSFDPSRCAGEPPG